MEYNSHRVQLYVVASTDTPVSLLGNAGFHGWKLPFLYAETVVSRLGTGVPTVGNEDFIL